MKSFAVRRGAISLTSRIFRRLRASVLDNGCRHNSVLARGELYRVLDMDHAPVHRTLHHLRRRGLVIRANGNSVILNVNRGSLCSVCLVHRRLRNLTTEVTTRDYARDRVGRLGSTLRLRRFCLTGRGDRRVGIVSGGFRRVLCGVDKDRIFCGALLPLRGGIRGCHGMSVRGASHTTRSMTRRGRVLSTVVGRSNGTTRGFATRRMEGTCGRVTKGSWWG